MEKISRLKRLLFILVGIILCIPVSVKAIDYDYESSFKFYKADVTEANFQMWGMQYSMGMVSPNEITDLSSLKTGDYLLVAPSLKTIGNNKLVSYTFFFTYDEEMMESPTVAPTPAAVIAAIMPGYGTSIYPNNSYTLSTYEVKDGNVSLNVTVPPAAAQPIDATNEGPAIFVLFKLKKDVTSETPLTFTWYTEDKMLKPSTGGEYYTIGSDADNNTVYIQTVDYIPEVPKSGVKALGGLSAVNGSNIYLNLTQDSELSPADNTFSATVPADISSVDLSITPKHAAASVAKKSSTKMFNLARSVMKAAARATNTLTDTVSLTTGVNTFTYTVTAEDETTEDYTVNILRLSDDVTLSALSLGADVTLSPAFVAGSSTDTYSATVPFTKDSLTITATATNSEATITGDGAWSLTNTGATVNTKKITVKAENCKTEYNGVTGNSCTEKDYTLNVTREAASTNNYLSNLTVNPGTLENLTEGHTGFNRDDNNYKVELDNNVANITITATAEDTKAKSVVIKKGTNTITNGASTALDVGDNDFVITVTAEDDSTRVYNLKAIRKSNEKGLASLTVTNGSYTYVLNPTFNSNGSDKDFTTIVPANINDVNINVTTKDSNASVQSGDGNRTLTGASTRLEFTILAQDGTTEVYSVTVKRLSDVATLDDITLIDITGTFDADAKTYTATNVPYQTKSTTVSATVTPSTNATIASGTGAWTLANSGATVNTQKIRVNAENCDYTTTQVPGNTCTYNEYTINVSRIAPSTDATLSNLTVSTGTLDPTFSATEHDYTVTVPNSVNSITINATANDANATVSGDGVKNNLTVGDNNFTITVKAEDGNNGTPYKVKVVRQSNDTTLSALSVTSTNGSLSPTFNKNTKIYTYTFNESVTSVTINATTTHAKASVQIGDEAASIRTATSTSINPNETNSVVVKVTAEDGTTTGGEYTINFERQKSSVNTLKKLEVKSGGNTYALSPAFVAGATPRSYTVTVPYEVDSVDIEAEATSPAATVSGNETGIAVGFSDVVKTVTVHPEEGSDGVYTITIKRTKSDEARLSDLKVNNTTISGFDKDDFEYDLGEVDSSVNSLAITYVTEEPNATAVIAGNSLTEGENTITITVTPQNGDTAKVKVYKIKVVQTSNDATLSSLIVTDNSTTGTGSLTPSFTSGNDTYTYTYPKDATSANIVATSAHNASITGDGDVTLSDGLEHTVSVLSQEGTPKTYTITFKKLLDNDSSLNSLSVMGDKEYATDFSATKINYSYKVPSDVTKVTINATANSTFAKDVVISNANQNGEVDLTSGINTITVKVTAEDDTSTTYTISIEREINQNATLTELKVKDGATELTLNPTFASGTTNYRVEVGYDVTSVDIEATATAGATITPTDLGSKALDTVGDNTFVINVTAEDGHTTGSYTIVVHRKSNDTTLSNLQASSGTLTKDDDTNYTLEISDKVNSVTITPSLNHGSASITNEAQLNNINLNALTDNKIEFEVVAEDNNYKGTYTINVVKLSSDAGINDLTLRHRVDGETSVANVVTPVGNTYNVTVPYGTDQVIVDTSVHDNKATIDTTMPITHDLSSGNTINFKVTAEDGTEANYQVIVTVDPNSNANLGDDGIKVFGKPAIWNETQKYYEVTVESTDVDLAPSDVEVSKSDSSATVTKGSAMELVADTPNDYTVTITAANGTTTKNYPIKITRPASTDNSLNSVTSTVGDVTEKDGVYVITLPVGTENFTVGATPTFKKASVTSGTGVKNVSDGDFNIEVTSESGSLATYQVKVETLGLSNDGENAGLSVEGYTLNPEFNSSTKTYSLNKNVEANVNSLTVLAHATGDVKITYALDNGEFGDSNVIDVSGKTGNGSIKVKITSNISGKEDIYTVGFNKLEKTGISALSVTDYNFKETFAEETYNYTIDGDVAHDTTSLTVNVTTIGSVVVRYQLDEQAQSTNNVIDVSSIVGAHTIKVIVTPNNGGDAKTYNIAFNKDSGETEKITSVNYGHKIENGYVMSGRPQVDASTFVTQFDNEASSLHVYRSDGTTEVTSGNVGTGMIIKLEKDGNVLDQLIIVIMGDTSGDGLVRINDASKIAAHYLGSNVLTGPYLIAADVSGDGMVRINDASKIAAYYLGTVDLYN